MQEKINILLEEYKRRNNIIDFSESRLPYQKRYNDNPSKKKAVVATRRSGKSFEAGLKAIETALQFENCKVLIIGLTRASIKGIYWNDILKKIVRDKKLKVRPLETTLEIIFENESTVQLLGMDNKEDEAAKVLGQKFKLVIVDEAASFTRDLKRIIEEFIEPGLIDSDGELRLLSTPTPFCGGYFYDVIHNTDGLHNNWYTEKWSALDNPFVAKNFQKKIDEILKANPNAINEPFFKIMYQGEYVHDISAQIYRVSDINYYKDLPQIDFVIVGVDIGYNDSDAIVAVGWQKHDPTLYLLEERQYPKQDITDLAEKLKEVEAIYQPKIIRRVMDAGALGKKIQEELAKRHYLYYEAAEKQRKFEYIQLLNGDLATGKVKLKRDSIFDKDSKLLLWDKSDPVKWKEAGNYHSDVTDAFLYAWRESTHYTERIKKIIRQNDADWGDKLEEKMIEDYEMEKAGYKDFDKDDDFLY